MPSTDCDAFLAARKRLRNDFEQQVEAIIDTHFPDASDPIRRIAAMEIRNAFLEHSLKITSLESTRNELMRLDNLD